MLELIIVAYFLISIIVVISFQVYNRINGNDPDIALEAFLFFFWPVVLFAVLTSVIICLIDELLKIRESYNKFLDYIAKKVNKDYKPDDWR